MAGQRGRDLLLKISDGAGGFVTLAGVRASRIRTGNWWCRISARWKARSRSPS